MKIVDIMKAEDEELFLTVASENYRGVITKIDSCGRSTGAAGTSQCRIRFSEG